MPLNFKIMEDIISISFSLIFWIIAARSNALCDTLAHHYSTSIFSDKSKYPEQIWNPKLSWVNKYIDGDQLKGRVKMKVFGIEFNKHVSQTDAWHYYKSLMIVCICMSIALHPSVNWYFIIADFIGYGLIWNATFNYYYNKKFKK